MSTSNFYWWNLEHDDGSDTSVAFIPGGAILRSREWDAGESPSLSPSVALVFIPGATRDDFFKDTNAPR